MKSIMLCAGVSLLAGCTSINIDRAIGDTNRVAGDFTAGQLALARTKTQSGAMHAAAAQLLRKPLSQDDAVHFAMLQSPVLQALLAQAWADSADAAQSGRIVNPLFTFERMSLRSDVELDRLLSVGLLDLLTLPQRRTIAKRRLQQTQWQLASAVIRHVTAVRAAWIQAVAAQQQLRYAQQVNESAQVGADLAQRMEAAGNFTRLQHARQQAFYADAISQLAAAQQHATATREQLVRMLGVTDAQLELLQLPERLPELPVLPRAPEDVSQSAMLNRLDLRIAEAELAVAARMQGLTRIASLVNIQAGTRRDSVFDNAAGTRGVRRGYELDVRLPIFDWGDLQRDVMNAHTLAAANRLEATRGSANSALREAYSAYRTSYDISKHFRDEVVPLRKLISDETLLRYNGMLVSVFELLADAREQTISVMAAIGAEQEFWLADASLRATIMGAVEK